jgi:hypothetical protein
MKPPFEYANIHLQEISKLQLENFEKRHGRKMFFSDIYLGSCDKRPINERAIYEPNPSDFCDIVNLRTKERYIREYPDCPFTKELLNETTAN